MSTANPLANFAELSPERVVQAAETALGRPLAPLAAALPSYINRVYEIRGRNRERMIVKFYRPERWSRTAIAAEHEFIRNCADAEVPVVAPLPLANGDTLAEIDGIVLAVFPMRAGRQFEIISDEDWRRLGAIVARIHLAGDEAPAPARIRLHPRTLTATMIAELLAEQVIPDDQARHFQQTCDDILAVITAMFDDCEEIRVHGDLHLGNLLHRPDEGLLVIDFDDMMTGPPVQDLWLLLPDHATRAQREISLLLDGYEQFREFDHYTRRLIEPLRAMRMIYFLAWCARQRHDRGFPRHFPQWGTPAFWAAEIRDLARQAAIIRETCFRRGGEI